jgi:hypothetical protein
MEIEPISQWPYSLRRISSEAMDAAEIMRRRRELSAGAFEIKRFSNRLPRDTAFLIWIRSTI